MVVLIFQENMFVLGIGILKKMSYTTNICLFEIRTW